MLEQEQRRVSLRKDTSDLRRAVKRVYAGEGEATKGIVTRPEFMQLWLGDLPTIHPDELVHDEVARTHVEMLFGQFAHALKRVKDPPVVSLYYDHRPESERPGYSVGNMEKRFRLRRLEDEGQDYLYYFPNNRLAPSSSVLRDSHHVLFDATADMLPGFGRVPLLGGPAEGYNVVKNDWQPNGSGIFRIGNERIGSLNLPRFSSDVRP